MKLLKVMVLSVAAGVAVGMWFGVNIGSNEPLLSNPFKASSLPQKIKEVSGETLEKGGQALEKTGQSLQKKVNP